MTDKKMEDLPQDLEMSKEEMKDVSGGAIRNLDGIRQTRPLAGEDTNLALGDDGSTNGGESWDDVGPILMQ